MINQSPAGKNGATTLGSCIRQAREHLGLSQKELAGSIRLRSGSMMTASYLCDIEHERRCPADEHIISAFADRLGIDRDWLFYLAGWLPPDVRERRYTREELFGIFDTLRRTTASGDQA